MVASHAGGLCSVCTPPELISGDLWQTRGFFRKHAVGSFTVHVSDLPSTPCARHTLSLSIHPARVLQADAGVGAAAAGPVVQSMPLLRVSGAVAAAQTTFI